MKRKNGFVQAYNAQAAGDAHGQVIVACGLTNNAADQAEIRPLLDAIAAGLGGSPKEVSADVGYCSEVNLETLAARGIRCGRVTVQDPGAQSFRSCQRVE